MKKKGNKKMPTQTQKVIQPHPYIFVSFSRLHTLCGFFSSKYSVGKIIHNENKDVGMGLDDFLSGWASSCSLSFS